MCGIVGGNNPNWNYQDAIQSILYRGPDGNRTENYGNITLSFCRLAIQDLSVMAMQPMSSPDRKVHVVYNGEIYGYQKIRDALSRKYEFRTTSDTEVILYAYLEYGENFIKEIDGIFAMAVYDERLQRIYLYRDRIGVKPLYYYFDGTQFAFASELGALENLFGTQMKLQIDHTALYDYLFYGYIPEPKTMYKKVYKLCPAKKLVFDVGESRIIGIDKYWHLHVNTLTGRTRKREDISYELRCLVEKSVREQLISDVPVGTFLSGGVDSSVISYETNVVKPDIMAYSIGFREAQYDESGRARFLCEKLKIRLSQEILSAHSVKEIKPCFRDWYCEPFGDTSAYPTYLVSKYAKTASTVVLTGDGGDELFGGYDRYRRLALLGEKLQKRDIYEQFAPASYAVEDLRKKWGIPKDYNPYWHFDEYIVDDMPTVTKLRYLDIHTYLPEDVLTKVDRVSMAVSLEARVPFLAKDVVEFAFSLSQEEYLAGNELKGCLKEAYRDMIPDEILYGMKMGFSVPDNYLWRENHEINIFAGIMKSQWNDLYEMYF